jgi:cytoskeletal protein RodZ
MTIGQRLREARDARAMTLDDVAGRTNIRQRFLQAIEDDDLATIPSSHRRLFVREFAKVVGIEPEAILAELPEVSPAIVAPEVTTRDAAPFRSEASETDRREYREILRGLSNSGGRLSSVMRNPAFMLIGAATVLLLTVAVYYFIVGDDSANAKMAVTSADSLAPTEILSGDVDTATAATPAVDTESGDSLTLEGRATARVWYTIVMDGKRSETGTLDSGGIKTWRAYEVFKVSLGNAGGLQLALNDRSIGTLGPSQSVVRSKYIDKDGIRTGPIRRPASTIAPTPTAPAKPSGRRAIAGRPGRSRPVRTNGPAPMKEIMTTQIR